MPDSPYAANEVTQIADPSMGQLGADNANVNGNLFADSYPGAPGRAADTGTGGGSDLAMRGLQQLQSGDQYGGIMTLLDAATESPQSVQNPQFLQALQIVESPSASGAQTQTDTSGAFSPPADSPAYGTTSDTTAGVAPQPGQSLNDANLIANQALQVAATSPAEGILGLMQASTMNPDLLNDQNFLTTMAQVLPQGSGADAGLQPQVQPGVDTAQPQVQPGMETAQPQAQPGMDTAQPQVQPGMETAQPQAQPGMETAQPQAQPGMETAQPQAQPGMETAQPQTQPGMDAAQPQLPSGSGQMPQSALQLPEKLTSSNNPEIESAVKEAFRCLQAGNQFDGTRILMMIAKADPSIMQDRAFIQNLVGLEASLQPPAAPVAMDAQGIQPSNTALEAQGLSQPTVTSADAQGLSQPTAPTGDTQGMTQPVPADTTQTASADPSIGAPAY